MTDANVEDWQSYREHLELYFITNDVKGKNKKVAILLLFCQFEHIVNITYCKLATWRLNELISLMTNHKNSKRDPLAEWFKFKMWNSRNDENISPYMAELRRLRQCCGYGDSLECRLRDVNQGASLWCKPGPYSSELLSESADLTLQKALYISLYLVVLWLSCQSEIMQEKLNPYYPKSDFLQRNFNWSAS